MAQLKINRGTTYIRSGTVSIDGVPADISTATVRFTMKTSEYDDDTDDSTASVLKNVTDGTANGEYEIELEPSDTAELVPGNYFYDIKVEFATGEIYKLDEGKVKLDGSPTNRLS